MPRSLLVVTAAVAVLTAGSLSLRACHDDEPVPVPEAGTTALTPTDSAAGMPLEAGRTGGRTEPRGDQAVDAAVAAIRATGRIATAGFITRSDLITSLATERFAPTLVATSAAQLAEMTAELGAAGVSPDELVWEEYPLTARLERLDHGRAVVEVWAVLVVGVPEAGAPRQVWRTVTVSMAREGQAWRVDDWLARPGPTPALAATSAVSDMASIAAVASWPATVDGSG